MTFYSSYSIAKKPDVAVRLSENAQNQTFIYLEFFEGVYIIRK